MQLLSYICTVLFMLFMPSLLSVLSGQDSAVEIRFLSLGEREWFRGEGEKHLKKERFRKGEAVYI